MQGPTKLHLGKYIFNHWHYGDQGTCHLTLNLNSIFGARYSLVCFSLLALWGNEPVCVKTFPSFSSLYNAPQPGFTVAPFSTAEDTFLFQCLVMRSASNKHSEAPTHMNMSEMGLPGQRLFRSWTVGKSFLSTRSIYSPNRKLN